MPRSDIDWTGSPCKVCGGNGKNPVNPKKQCENCGGTGVVDD